MFSVELTEASRALETYLPTGGGVMLSPRDEVCDWLADNGLSLVSIEPDRVVNPFTGARLTRGLIFNFENDADALLFKLTWGGA